MSRRRILVMGIGGSLFILAVFLGLACGTYGVSLSELIATFMGKGSRLQETVIYQLRMPRVFVAVFVGIALSTAGCILQGVTRNPLAEPGMIGINAGASLAVILFISFRSSNYYEDLGISTILLMPLVSIAGALFVSLIIYLLSNRKGIAPTRLILVGIGINAGITAIITFYQLNMSKGDYNQALTWISGSLWGTSWIYFYITAPFITILFLLTLYKCRTLDALELGDEISTGLGLDVKKERIQLLILAVLSCALATSVAGNITFLGLLGPHIAKRMVGAVHIRQIPAAALVSSTLIILADTASRNLFTPLEIPVGVTLSVIGVPYFIYLMIKEK